MKPRRLKVKAVNSMKMTIQTGWAIDSGTKKAEVVRMTMPMSRDLAAAAPTKPSTISVAEIGAAFLAADLGLYAEPRKDHASYLDSWLKVLKADKRAIFHAASKAQQAADFLHERAKPAPLVLSKGKDAMCFTAPNSAEAMAA